MPNSKLEGKTYVIPHKLYSNLKLIHKSHKGDEDKDGYKRLTNLIKSKNVSYYEMKRLKNYFDNFNGDIKSIEYNLNGGEQLKNWVNSTLSKDRNIIDGEKKDLKNIGMNNQYKKEKNLTTEKKIYFNSRQIKVILENNDKKM